MNTPVCIRGSFTVTELFRCLFTFKHLIIVLKHSCDVHRAASSSARMLQSKIPGFGINFDPTAKINVCFFKQWICWTELFNYFFTQQSQKRSGLVYNSWICHHRHGWNTFWDHHQAVQFCCRKHAWNMSWSLVKVSGGLLKKFLGELFLKGKSWRLVKMSWSFHNYLVLVPEKTSSKCLYIYSKYQVLFPQIPGKCLDVSFDILLFCHENSC